MIAAKRAGRSGIPGARAVTGLAGVGDWPRERVFAVVFAALAINGAATLAIQAIQAEGWVAATLNLWGISAILWVAGAAGCATMLTGSATPPRRGDGVALTVAGLAMLMPTPAASSVALSALCGWAILTAPPRSPLARAALIFLAITGSLFWGRLVLAMGSGVFLGLDGAMVGLVAGSAGSGNLVHFAGRADAFLIAPGCSSLQGVSLAVVLWVATTQYFDVTPTPRTVLTLAAMLVGAIGANVLRLAAIATWPERFDMLHVGIGATAFGWLGFALIVGALWIGLRHALRA